MARMALRVTSSTNDDMHFHIDIQFDFDISINSNSSYTPIVTILNLFFFQCTQQCNIYLS